MIRITQLEFAYKIRQKLFKSLGLELKSGCIHGLLGKNGSGKSTLLKLISGMVFPKAGEVECLGYTPSERYPSFMEQIYYITDEIDQPAETMTRYARQIGKFYTNFSMEDLQSYMSEFDLDMNVNLSSLSLGQKKKAAIAFALACNTKLLLMDEPTNGLDIPSKSQFRRLISRIATPDRTIIISTHQVRDLENLIDNVVILDDNKILANISIEDISRKMLFKQIEKGDEPLYSESGLLGSSGIVENTENIDGKVDFELLFNAAISHAEPFLKLLNK